MRRLTAIFLLIILFASKASFCQVTDSLWLPQKEGLIRYTDIRGRFTIEINRVRESKGIIDLTFINLSQKIIGYYKYFNNDKIYVPSHNYWTPTFSNFEPLSDAGWGVMTLIYPNNRKLYTIDINKFSSYNFDFYYCNDMQKFIDSVIAKDVENWQHVDLASQKPIEIGAPYSSSDSFTEIYLNGISADPVKYPFIECKIIN